MTSSVESAWKAYQQAFHDLHRTTVSPTGDIERGGGEISTVQFEERSNTLLTRSQELRSILSSTLETEGEQQSELAVLKLVAASAYDLSVASELVELDSQGTTDVVERGANSAALAALRGVLDAPVASGINGLLEIERTVLPKAPGAARAQLEITIDNMISTIPQDAASLCQTVVGGIIGTGLSLPHSIATQVAQEVLTLVPEGISLVAQRAVQFLVEAIQKLWAALGRDRQQQVQQHASTWLKDFVQNQGIIGALLDKLYETERIRQEAIALVEASPQELEAARYNQATQTLEELQGRYSKIKTVLQWVLRLLAGVQSLLLGAIPWGPIGVYDTYLGILSYAIYSGGDYLDWYFLEEYAWLPSVQGLRTTVRQALGTSEASH